MRWLSPISSRLSLPQGGLRLSSDVPPPFFVVAAPLCDVGGFIDPSNGRRTALSAGAFDRVVRPAGLALQPGNTAVSFAHNASFDADLAVHTHAYVFWVDAWGNSTSSADCYFSTSTTASGNVRVYIRDTGVGVRLANTTVANAIPGGRLGLNSIVLRVADAQTDVWLNGEYSTISTAATSWAAGTQGGIFKSSGTTSNGHLYWMAAWKGDHAHLGPLLSREPMRFFAPERRIWAPTPAAAGGAENYGIGTETDTALSPTAKLLASPGLASETDTALSPAASLLASPGIAAETDTALAPAAQLRANYGLAQETDTAFALAGAISNVYGVAQEADNAYALSASLRASYGIAAELDTAFALPVAGVAYGVASETDTAYPLPAQLRTNYGICVEIDRAYALATPGAPAPSPSPAPSPLPPGPGASFDSEFRSSRNRRFTRPQLAKFLGSAEEIRAFEALDFDTAEATPDAIEEIRQYLATLPPPQPQPNPDQGDGLEVHVGVLQAQIEELRGLLMEKSAQITALSTRVKGLEQGYHI